MASSVHPVTLRHGGLWWRILTHLTQQPGRFGEVFRATRANRDCRRAEIARLRSALNFMHRAGLIARVEFGIFHTAHGVRELQRVNAEHLEAIRRDEAA